MGHPPHFLSGSDYFHLLLDKQMRQRGLPGNISRIHLQLAQSANLQSIAAQLRANATLTQVYRLRIHQQLFRIPQWIEADSPLTSAVVLHPKQLSPEAFEREVMQAIVPEREQLVRIDLAQTTDGAHHAVVAMHHVLFDHKGMQLFLSALAQTNDAESPTSFFAPSATPSTWTDLAQAFRATLFAFRSGGWKLASLIHRNTPLNSPAHYLTIPLTEAETTHADTLAMQCGGASGRSAFYLAALLMAVRHVFAQRNEFPPYYWVPVPHDMRKKGANGHLVGNALSFFYFKVYDHQLTSIADAVAAIQQQMMLQVRQKQPWKLEALLRVFRRVPLPLMEAMMHLSSGGKVSTFAFSDLGEQRHTIRHFCGAEVLQIAHIPPVPCPPGLSVVLARQNGHLHLILGSLPQVLTSEEVALLHKHFKSLVLRDLNSK